PKVFGEAMGERGLGGLEALVAVFSMGNRSLKRRRLRSLFTFTAILALTMSFVALTSLSTSYGLIFNRSGTDKPDAEGILVRSPEYTPQNELQKGWFSPIIPPIVEWAWENEGVINVAEKAENFPSVRPYGRIGDWPIFGVVGLQLEVEPLMPLIDERVVYGEPLREEGTCLLHRYMRQNAKIGVGDQIVIRGVPMRVVGFFEGLLPIADVDGETILPKYQVIVSTDPIMIEVRVCNEYEVAITTMETALSIDDVHVSRIDVELEPGSNLETIGKSMALSREYRVWISEGGSAHLAYMGSQIGGKGLPIIVPWAIVILNVVTTMLNSMYERHREIDILSSIGLNPRDIAGVFLAEVSILGVTGGGIGYLMGLGLYPLMTSIGLAPVVSQKVSAVWLVAALGISMASVIFGSMMALRGSVGLTPSLTRRWTSGDQMVSRKGTWETRLPVRIEEEHLEEFASYLKDYLARFTGLDSVPRVGNVKQTAEEGRMTLHFSYNQMDSNIRATRTSNVITLARDEEGFYLPTLESMGERDAASKTGTFVRGIVIRWSTEHRDEG
ncbi:MAG: ABC transporter permease, partial [Candidatus Bathyarchaeota archaeon]|nr:ABC transporter permease [Candidatus Bathyarchaeota archaeon]